MGTVISACGDVIKTFIDTHNILSNEVCDALAKFLLDKRAGQFIIHKGENGGDLKVEERFAPRKIK